MKLYFHLQLLHETIFSFTTVAWNYISIYNRRMKLYFILQLLHETIFSFTTVAWNCISCYNCCMKLYFLLQLLHETVFPVTTVAWKNIVFFYNCSMKTIELQTKQQKEGIQQTKFIPSISMFYRLENTVFTFSVDMLFTCMCRELCCWYVFTCMCKWYNAGYFTS